MEELKKSVQALATEIEQAVKKIGLAKSESELESLEQTSRKLDFWQDNLAAQKTMKQIAALQARLEPWQKLLAAINELEELVSVNDPKLKDDLLEQQKKLSADFLKLKDELKLSGPYDDHSAILGIYAGAGGTDAQDWAEMLLRMYTRYGEKAGLKVRLIEQVAGEEAGIKSATLELDGNFAYGKLKGEHGVHRLVRLSPFNADNLRQTSFAKVEILPKIEEQSELKIDDKDLKVDTFRAGGHGGQSVNTTDSAVRVTHLPTGISVAIQNERSQLQNKETALTILRSRLAQLQLEQHQKALSKLKGPNQSAEWGNQIRSYVLHPYKQVKDLRSHYETSDPQAVLDGELDPLIEAYLESSLQSEK